MNKFKESLKAFNLKTLVEFNYIMNLAEGNKIKDIPTARKNVQELVDQLTLEKRQRSINARKNPDVSSQDICPSPGCGSSRYVTKIETEEGTGKQIVYKECLDCWYSSYKE